MGKIRYRGMTVRPKGVSFRSTEPRVSDGKHEAIISEALWRRAQAVRASRRVNVKSIKKTVRINLLQSLVVCSYCGKRLNIQTPKNCATYYRENSHHRGYHDCLYIGQSVRAEVIDALVARVTNWPAPNRAEQYRNSIILHWISHCVQFSFPPDLSIHHYWLNRLNVNSECGITHLLHGWQN